MYRVYVRQANTKMRTVWIYGRTNSGKSFLSDSLNMIFIHNVFTNSDSKYTAQEQRSEFETQLVSIDEANYNVLFAPTRVARSKKLLEGKGWEIECKFEDPMRAYENASVFMSTNGLPKISEY